MEKIQKTFFITLFARKNPERNKLDVISSLKRSLHRHRKINETLNLIFGLGHEVRSSSKKRTLIYIFEKFKSFWQKNEGVILDVQEVAYMLFFSK